MGVPTIGKHNEIVEKHLHIAEHLAKRWAERQNPRISVDDLLGPANLGLVKAAADYDSAKSDNFPNYARLRISGEIKDYLRDNDHLSRLDREIVREYESLEGTIEERAEKMGLSAEQIAHLMTIPDKIHNELRTDLRDKEQWEDNPLSMGAYSNNLLDHASGEEQGYDELENVVEACCQFLMPKTAHCFRLRHLNGKGYQEISVEVGISKTCVFTRLKNAYKFLSEHQTLRNRLGLEPGETRVSIN